MKCKYATSDIKELFFVRVKCKCDGNLPSGWISVKDVRELLNKYTDWLFDNGYLDTDYYNREPETVDAFMNEINVVPPKEGE